jgi:hypothetical protein
MTQEQILDRVRKLPAMPVTFLLGAEGCAEVGDVPWLRDATETETELLRRTLAAIEVNLDAVTVDGMGRPYWVKTLTSDAPETYRERAERLHRLVRLEP